MNKYVKEIKKYVFSSDLVKGKAYHIINHNITTIDDMKKENKTSAITAMPKEFDAIFSFVDNVGDAVFLAINADVEWINIKANDVANGYIEIVDMIQDIASFYKIEKPNLDPEYVKSLLKDVKTGVLQPRLNFDNAVSQAIDDLEKVRKHREDLEEAHENMYGVAHKPTVVEKESFFIEPDPNVHPV